MSIHNTKYWLKARHRKGHGVHSPFAFALVREVLYNCYGNYSAFYGDKRANAVLFSARKFACFLVRLNLFLQERNIQRFDFRANEEQIAAIRELRRTSDWDHFWSVFRDDAGRCVNPARNGQCWVFHRPYDREETRWLVKTLFRESHVEVGMNLRKLWLGFRNDRLQHQHYTILF